MRIEKLEPRLRTIAKMVKPGNVLADIGTDHGYLITALAADGLVPRGFACDIREMPLLKAREEVRRCRLEDRVSCLLGDGLALLGPNDADTVVIAGMGGDVMMGILERCPWENKEEKQWLLQPMSKIPFVRKSLLEGGYRILKERAARSGKHVYTVMEAGYLGAPKEADELYCHLGELLDDPSDEAAGYLMHTAASLLKKAEGLRKAGDPKSVRYQQMSAAIRRLTEER